MIGISELPLRKSLSMLKSKEILISSLLFSISSDFLSVILQSLLKLFDQIAASADSDLLYCS